MRAKSLILMVVATGCGLIAAVAASRAVVDKGSSQIAEATVEIFVAVTDLEIAERISAENVKLERWPRSRLPEGALVNLEQVEGKFTKQTIFAGEPILERKIADSRESFSTGIPAGYRVFDIPGSGDYFKPGDHVDVVGTFRIQGRNSIPEIRTVMRNVQVFGINGITTRDSDEAKTGNRGNVFQLLVKESQLEALTLAESLGELRLSLRPFGEDSLRQKDTDNGEQFLNWLEESGRKEVAAATPSAETFTSLIPSLPVKPMEEKKEIRVITPQGVIRYEYCGNELPRPIVEASQNGVPGSPSQMPASGWGTPSGNVYSGYGGYPPTYPTTASPAAPSEQGSSQPTSEETEVQSIE